MFRGTAVQDERGGHPARSCGYYHNCQHTLGEYFIQVDSPSVRQHGKYENCEYEEDGKHEHEHEHEHGEHGQSAAHQHDEHEEHEIRADHFADSDP